MNKFVAHAICRRRYRVPGGDGRGQNNHSLSEKHGLRGMPLDRQGKLASRFGVTTVAVSYKDRTASPMTMSKPM